MLVFLQTGLELDVWRGGGILVVGEVWEGGLFLVHNVI